MIRRMVGSTRLSVDTCREVEKDSGAPLKALIVVIVFTIANIVGGVLDRGRMPIWSQHSPSAYLRGRRVGPCGPRQPG